MHAGGDGIVRELELLAPTTVTLVGERRRRPPYGLSGGGPGTARRGHAHAAASGTVRLPGKITFAAHAGDRLTIATPGGGGHGDPMRAKFWATVLSGEPLTLD